MASFAGTQLTPASIAAARQWYHDNAVQCAAEAKNDDQRAFWDAAAASALEGERMSVAMLQRAHFIQTGESVALLP